MCEFSLVEETSTVSPQGYFTSILLPCQLEAGGQTRGITWTSTHLQFLSKIVSFFQLHNAQVLNILPVKIPTVSTCTSTQALYGPSKLLLPIRHLSRMPPLQQQQQLARRG